MSMTITPDSCPQCGAQIKGTCDVIPGTARVFQNHDGTFEFSGETDVHWDGQQTKTEGGKARVICTEGHEFLAELTDQ